MAYELSEETKRKLHYKALMIGTLKALKTYIEDQPTNELLDEVIDIADKLGDGYKLCKVIEVISDASDYAEGMKLAIILEGDK